MFSRVLLPGVHHSQVQRKPTNLFHPAFYLCAPQPHGDQLQQILYRKITPLRSFRSEKFPFPSHSTHHYATCNAAPCTASQKTLQHDMKAIKKQQLFSVNFTIKINGLRFLVCERAKPARRPKMLDFTKNSHDRGVELDARALCPSHLKQEFCNVIVLIGTAVVE